MEPGNLIDEVFTEDEMTVLYTFIDKGGRVASYRSVFGDAKSKSAIYYWFRNPAVQMKIIEIGDSLSVYDTVCDKTLISIITSSSTNNRDKIAAIKTWNDLRDRVHTTIKLDVEKKLDLSNITTENLGEVVNAILKVRNGEDSGRTDS